MLPRSLVVLIFLPVAANTGEYSGDHSLLIYVMFAPEHKYLPTYSSYGMLDDYRVFSYDSISEAFFSPLRHHDSLSTVWRDLKDCTNFKSVYFNHFRRHANETLGLNGPLLQLIYGCRLYQDGTFTGVYQFSVNGKHTLSLDPESSLWSAHHTRQASEIKKILDRFELWNKSNLIYMQRDCVPRLKIFYEQSKKVIHRKARPEASIKFRQTDKGVLTCVVTGFYPKDITVEWHLDGMPVTLDVTSTEILPNHDLTYQVQKMVVVSTLFKNYSCHVQHSSLSQPVVIQWDPSSTLSPRDLLSKHIGLIGAFCLVTVVLIIMIVLMCKTWRQK